MLQLDCVLLTLAEVRCVLAALELASLLLCQIGSRRKYLLDLAYTQTGGLRLMPSTSLTL